MTIAVLGGTGPEGLGLAARLLAAGETVVIGSRTEERAAGAAGKLRERVPGSSFRGATNVDAAAAGGMIVVAVPAAGLDDTLETCAVHFRGKLVLDVVVPIRLDRGTFLLEPIAEGSAGERIAARVPEARVVSGFKHQAAADLFEVERELESDVLLCGDDAEAKELVAALVRRISKLRPVDAGSLRVSRHLDAVTALLLNLNRLHRARASVKITGV
jgi:8-hydroxy-5-deazaflavin:NADPH oxidoreductase